MTNYRRDGDAIHQRIAARLKASVDREARLWPANEGPAQHIRNAIQLLRFGRPEEAEARLWRAVEQLERESRT